MKNILICYHLLEEEFVSFVLLITLCQFKLAGTQICQDTPDVGDEFHFILECPELQDLLTVLLPRFCHNNPNMLKLETLMTSVSIFMLNKLAKLISRGCQKLNIYIELLQSPIK